MKEKTKRLVSLILCAVIMLSFCACGKDDPVETTEPIQTTEPTTEPPTEPTTEPTTVPTTVPPTTVPMEMTGTEISAYARERTVTIHAEFGNNRVGEGSGFFISDDGIVVTCYHVIDGARGLSIEVNNGGHYKVERILDIDPLHDVAVLKIDVQNTPFFELGYALGGEEVRAIGSSLGTLQGTISQGIVSNKSNRVGVIDCIQTDAAISNGNSGGPLINMYGEVIGINAYSYTGGQNLNLAVDVEYVRALAKDKDWGINDYMEWYDVQTSRSYRIYSYVDKSMHPSLVNTYGDITGASCRYSAWDWDSEDIVEGYDKNQSIFLYEYSSSQMDEYFAYLKSIGFVYDESSSNGAEGYFEYIDNFNGYTARIIVTDNNAFIAVEIVHGAN